MLDSKQRTRQYLKTFLVKLIQDKVSQDMQTVISVKDFIILVLELMEVEQQASPSCPSLTVNSVGENCCTRKLLLAAQEIYH